MASPAMNAALRLSTRSTTHKISHVLSGSTRSLSWTSNQASRASAARSTAAYSLITSQYLSHQQLRAREFSSSSRVADALREQQQATEQAAPKEEGAETEAQATENAAFVPKQYAPSKTVYVGSLPFFATEEDVRRVIGAAAPIKEVRFGKGKYQQSAPFAHVTFESMEDAVAVVESAKQEPFFLEGRALNVNYTMARRYPPSARLFFDNFHGDMVQLRDYLGEHARWVDNARFTFDKAKRELKPSGLIQFHSIEEASRALEFLHKRPGPDGAPVYIRFARVSPENGTTGRRQSDQDRENDDGYQGNSRANGRDGEQFWSFGAEQV